MSNKKKFIEFVEQNLFDDLVLEEIDPEVIEYWNELKNGKTNEKKALTDNGKILMNFFQSNPSDVAYSSKDIAEELFIQARTVSGAMRSLVNNGYVEKIEGKPIKYKVTDEGLNLIIE